MPEPNNIKNLEDLAAPPGAKPNDEPGGTTPTGGTPSTKEDDIAKRLTQIQESLTESQALAKLVADPNVRAILEAQQRGDEIKILVGDEIKTPASNKTPVADAAGPSLPDNIDSLSNSELVGLMLDKIVGAVESKVKEHIGPISSTVDGFVKDRKKATDTMIQQQITSARESYEDFDTYQSDMIDINKSNPGLDVTELYLLAKRRRHKLSGASDKPRGSTESEVPTDGGAGAPVVRENASVGLPGFDKILSAAIDKLDLTALEK